MGDDIKEAGLARILGARPTLTALLPLSLVFCKALHAQQRAPTSQREFHLTGRAAIAVVKPLNSGGRLGSAELQFLEEFNRAADSLEAAGYLIAITLRDTIVVVPPADSFKLPPWTIVNKHSSAFFFTPGRSPYELYPTTSQQLLMWLAALERRPRQARTVLTVRPQSLTFRAVTVGGEHSCGLTADGKAFCWGSNQYGQLGNGTAVGAGQPIAVAGGLRFVELSAGITHTCGLIAGGRAFCWGAMGGRPVREPVAVPGGLQFVQISAGNFHTCGRTGEGRGYCWGNYGAGQLGNGTSYAGTGPLSTQTPVAITGHLRFLQLNAGAGGHTCGLTTDGRAWCWGANDDGQLGDGTKNPSAIPVQVAGTLRLFELDALGAKHTCGRTGDGQAFCWGDNFLGQLGDSTQTDRTTPTAVVGGLHFVELSAGNYHTCGRTPEGLGFCWGGSNNGERGDGMDRVGSTPAAVASGLRFVELHAGGGHTCARTKESAAFCWGWNGHGELGDGTTIASQGPVQVVPRP